MYHDGEGKPVSKWYVACGVMVGFWAVLEVLLSLLGWRRGADALGDVRSDVEVAVIKPPPASPDRTKDLASGHDRRE